MNYNQNVKLYQTSDCTYNEEFYTSSSIKGYFDVMTRVIKTNFPDLKLEDIDNIIRYSIDKRYKEERATIDNNYTNKKINISLKEVTDYIIDREPIFTAYGLLWSRKGNKPNPLVHMTEKFMNQRGIHKKEMFKYQKGSEEFQKYNLLQLLDKIDSNGLYGVLGMYSSMFYNLHVAASITSQGRELTSSAGMCFEMFLANNVKFGSLDEVIAFIDNVICETPERKFDDAVVLDRNISREECFTKIVKTCGFESIPDNDDLNIIWDYICKLDQQNINRLFYKNNLYGFMENKLPTEMVKGLLELLEAPYMAPNEPPEEIAAEIEPFTELLMEYVYYHHMIPDRVWRMDNMIKDICCISDTDSTIISLDAWYRCILEKVKGIKFKLMYPVMNLVDFMDIDENTGEYPVQKLVEFEEPNITYDFYEDEVIEEERQYNLLEVIPQDGLRYSIINILAYVLDKVINDYMYRFCKKSNSSVEPGDCKIIMKNEFLFKRALLTMVKKNYATIQELQEGNIVAHDERPDIKGLAIGKSTMNDKTKKALKSLLVEDILDIPKIDQMDIVNKLAILEDSIFQSLVTGSKEYFKPVTVKSKGSYENPMRIQGIKASVAWNAIKDDYMEPLDLNERNSIDIVKVVITGTTLEKIKDTYPEQYARMISVVGTKQQPATNRECAEVFKGTITAVALPKDVEVPIWLKPFIDTQTIINDNLCNFPLESIGIRKPGKSVNYSNIVNL